MTIDDSGGLDDVTSRKGRFRVSSSNTAGPPETTLGRFRLIPQSM